MADIEQLVISYPDFALGNTMNPEEFDQNNTEIVNKINELIDASVISDDVKALRINSDGVLETTVDGVNWLTATTQGIQGIQGEIGVQGEQGIQGIQGVVGKTIIPSVDENGIMSFTIQDTAIAPPSVSVKGTQGIQGVQGVQGVQGATGAQGVQGVQGNQGIQGEKGESGADGRSFTILALYATLFDLQTEHEVGEVGNAYAVGTASSNVIYIWDIDTSAWKNIGAMQGVQGERGIQGIQGIQGEQGIQGVDGAQGIAGISAYASAVEGGYAGTEVEYNALMQLLPENIIYKSPTEPEGTEEGRVWLDTSDDEYQGTVFAELFTSVSNGKTAIATAITGKGGTATGSDTFTELATEISNVATWDADLVTSNIKDGVNIFGVVGSVIPAKPLATGTGTTSSSGVATVTGLTFQPWLVIIEGYMSSGYNRFVYYADATHALLNREHIFAYPPTTISGSTTTTVWTITSNGFSVGLSTNTDYYNKTFSWIAIGL